MIQLEDRDGTLYAGEKLLICRYSSGDVDTISWPNTNRNNLRRALYDERETGGIPNESIVLLPDGSEFNIDGPVFEEGNEVEWLDPDNGACSRTGIIETVYYEGDMLHIRMCDGYEIEVLESELRHI